MDPSVQTPLYGLLWAFPVVGGQEDKEWNQILTLFDLVDLFLGQSSKQFRELDGIENLFVPNVVSFADTLALANAAMVAPAAGTND